MLDTAVAAKNVYKIFGNTPEAAIAASREGLSKDEIYEKTGCVVAVNNVSFEVNPGEVFCVMGLSGSGKSTLIRCLNRLQTVTGGEISMAGEDVVHADDEALRQIRLRKASMVFQHFALLPHMTVAENAAFGLKMRGMGRAERYEKAVEALALVGLEAWADSYPGMLSGGMQQRVGLARGLAVDPEILLMDEPFSALDPLIRKDMQEELVALQGRLKTTIVFITHDLHEALHLGDKIAIMKDGRFVQVGAPEEIVTQPADDYVAAFTKDVDRSRVLKAGTVMRDAAPIHVGRGDAETVTADMADGRGFRYVVDDDGKPLGLVSAADINGGSRPRNLGDLAATDFPRVDERTVLYDMFDICADRRPVAVTDADGRLAGVIDAEQVLSQLQPPNDNDAESRSSFEAAS